MAGNTLMSDKICAVHRLGLVEYENAWRLQDQMAVEIAAGKRPPTLLLLEHPPTYTFGRRGKDENLLWNEDELSSRGAAVHWVDRGGDITYHGPGQLVGYPLIPLAVGNLVPTGEDKDNLRLPQADYVGYVRRLEKVLVVALASFGMAAGQIKGLTGVWVQADVHSRCRACRPEERLLPAKIAAIGVKVDARGISRHGFALNVDPDMSYWQGIIACGLKDYPVASLAELLDSYPKMEQVMDAVESAFGQEFGFITVKGSL
jgi:lipoyl(octanoyl) transferase